MVAGSQGGKRIDKRTVCSEKNDDNELNITNRVVLALSEHHKDQPLLPLKKGVGVSIPLVDAYENNREPGALISKFGQPPFDGNIGSLRSLLC